MVKRIRVTVDGVTYHAALLENPLSEKNAGMCPFTLDCMRSGEHEYYAVLPQKTKAMTARLQWRDIGTDYIILRDGLWKVAVPFYISGKCCNYDGRHRY